MSDFSLELAFGKINEAVENHVFGDEPKNLYEPLSYILQLGGKRARPLLTLMGAQMFEDNWENALQPSLATEVFHNFSLIHDDIMDEAPLRRGKETVHTKWNQNIAILSGDVMLVKAYELLASVGAEKLPEALRLFNKCATEVCEGQQYDMDFETRTDVSKEEYLHMIKLKTAVLLGFSLRLGAIIGGASEEDAVLLEEFGVKVGIGFQLKDDLLDVFGDQEKVGKQVGGDIISNKKTFLLIDACERASGNEKKELEFWLSAPKFEPEEKVAGVKEIYYELGVKVAAEQVMNKYFDEAFRCLEKVSVADDKKQFLKGYAEYLINRDK